MDLNILLDRLQKDVEGMPWQDSGISHLQLRQSVLYFIKVFTEDLKAELEKQNAKKTTNRKTTSS